MLKTVTLELTLSQALALRELIDGFYLYQHRANEGEQSRRTILACELLKQLPNPLDGNEGRYTVSEKV